MDFLNSALSTDNPSHIKSIQKAIIVIELLAKEDGELSLMEIAQRLNWPKSTLHGILATLRDFQYIDQSLETGRYSLGVRFFELGSQVAKKWDIVKVAKPLMKQLSNKTGLTIQLGIEREGKVLYLEKAEANSMVRIVSEVGTRLPMHCSGLGKTLLAYMNPAQVNHILKEHGMKKFTENTITNEKKLKMELEKIANQGYAIDNAEIMDGLMCLALPIRNGNGEALYALSASGLSAQFTWDKMTTILHDLQESVDKIEEFLRLNTY